MSETLRQDPMDRPRRIAMISQRTERPSRGHPVLFRGRYHEFPVTTIPQEALVYRVDNGRLASDLEEHAAATATSLSALRVAAETAEVQGLLHNLLVAKARSLEGPIFAELERLGQQTEPLLVMFDGVVLNGNRRLAAMRELLGRDPRRYAFDEPAVAVLPQEMEAQDIEFVEAALQMAPETKLRYGWLDRRLTLRKQRNVLRLPVDDIRAAYRIDDVAELDRELAELALAEEYLRDYRGEPARYSEIPDAEDLFVGLNKQLPRLQGSDRQFWRVAGFAMIDGRVRQLPGQPGKGGAKTLPDKTASPFARFFPFSAAVPPELPVAAQRRLAVRFGLEDAQTTAGAATPNRRASADMLAIFRDKSRSKTTAKLIADVLDELRLEHSERSAPQVMLQKVREAGQLISRLEPERLSAEHRRQLRGDLAALRSHAAYLMGEIEDKPSVPGRWNYPKAIFRPPFAKVPWRILRRMGWKSANRPH